METAGIEEGTVKSVSYRLEYLQKNNVELGNPEEVNVFISRMKQANSYKNQIVKAYNYYTEVNGIQWNRRKYNYQRKIPLIPTNERVKMIIANASKKYETISTILDETGLGGEELHNTDTELQTPQLCLWVRAFFGSAMHAYCSGWHIRIL